MSTPCFHAFLGTSGLICTPAAGTLSNLEQLPSFAVRWLPSVPGRDDPRLMAPPTGDVHRTHVPGRRGVLARPVGLQMTNAVYTVHTMRPDDIGAVEIVFITEREARAYAVDRSKDWRVLAASVTRFTVGHLGTRHPVAWFVDGQEQSQREPRPGAFYPTDGNPALRSS
jgi:hypothetical protein